MNIYITNDKMAVVFMSSGYRYSSIRFQTPRQTITTSEPIMQTLKKLSKTYSHDPVPSCNQNKILTIKTNLFV